MPYDIRPPASQKERSGYIAGMRHCSTNAVNWAGRAEVKASGRKISPLLGFSFKDRIRRSMPELSPLGLSTDTIPDASAISSIDLRNAAALFPGSGL